MPELMAATAEIDFDTPSGLYLTGYLARTSPSIGTHDSLKVRSIVFSHDSTLFAMAVCDLLGLSSEIIQDICGTVEESTGIPSDNVLVVCSHTHSGPASMHLQGFGDTENKWLTQVKNTVVQCIEKAYRNLKRTRLFYKTGECDANYNRVIGSGAEALSLRDTQVSVLQLRDFADCELDSLLVNYPCHPVTLDHNNLLYSSDYPFFMMETLKKNYAQNPSILFSCGCCGDLDPRERGGFDTTRRVGEKLAESILKIDPNNFLENEIVIDSISVKTFNIDIPLDFELDEQSLRAQINEYDTDLKEYKQSDADLYPVKVLKAYRHWAEEMLEMLSKGPLPRTISADVKLIKLGKLVIVSLPFEVFHDIGLTIKEHFGLNNTMVICYANGDFGYMSSEKMYPKSRYEMQEAYKYYGYPGPVAKWAENVLYKKLFES